ncbi:unnamed protein product [Hermetia illucens]|uniref:Myb-like, SWIRM and MPN domain-containing protein 1 n=1 Tax=Hermetia illucens TaxID=343691 RepID=A0A7R8YVQ1_HERIL|nr:histone H2A deubiquitinase MYSM1-like [Hermetia illucens]CAD7086011.1 unnamed protein product [Hermetia illucens]
MDEEEEIDIVGGSYDNFMSKNDQDISKISSGQLLSCDYTVHPNWLNENAEGGSYWTDSVPKSENLENNVQILHSEEVVIEEPEPVPNIAEVEWTGEIGSHEDLVFEDDIPASIEEVVTNQEEEENTILEASPTTSETDNFDLETAAYETHPPPENIKFIGPTHSRSLLKVKMESPVESKASSSRSLLKTNVKGDGVRPLTKFRQTLSVNSNLLKMVQKSQAARKITFREPSPIAKKVKPPKKAPPKFKETVKMSSRDMQNGKVAPLSKKYKLFAMGAGKSKHKPKKQKRNRLSGDENITISHEMESPKPIVSMSPGVVVKLDKCESDSDVEVDIESDTPTETKETVSSPENSITSPKIEPQVEIPVAKSFEHQTSEDEELPKIPLAQRFPSLSAALIAELQSHDIPTEELRINPNQVSELEKFIHSDFFENRTTKTPEQYLRIRNHILSMWQISKPNYISKTAVRVGLKHGGDVNCISRIHRLLEQIGAINFGLDGKCFDYVRPLETFISMFIQVPRNRTNSNSFPAIQQFKERRQRIRTNTFSTVAEGDGDDADVNYTIVHMDGIMRPNPPPQKDSNTTKQRTNTRHIRSELDLIKCLTFSEDNSPPFTISITLSTLLCLRLHALSSQHEVMGFLGGYQSHSAGKKRIHLTRYKPCRTSAQSGTTCEMCPVSQVEQSASLNSEGYELLGWFHSHPLFPANPSRTDIRTQKEMQLQFSFDNDRPFVGLILSCLNMTLKCIYMMPTNSMENKFDGDNNLPYEIDVNIIKDCASFRVDVNDVMSLLRSNEMKEYEMGELCDKFKMSSESILQQLGYNSESFFDDLF